MREVFLKGEMVYSCPFWKWFTQRFFGYQNMFKNVVILIPAWMIRHTNNFISIGIKLLLPRFSKMMVIDKPQWFPVFPSLFRTGPWSNPCFLTTSALAQTFFDHVDLLKEKKPISQWCEKWLTISPATLGLGFNGKKIPLSHTSSNYTLMRNMLSRGRNVFLRLGADFDLESFRAMVDPIVHKKR